MTGTEFDNYLRKKYKNLKDPKLREFFVQVQQLYYESGGVLMHLSESNPNKACVREDIRGAVIHAGRAARLTNQSVKKITDDDKKALRSAQASLRRNRKKTPVPIAK
jgi:hypothetical protein